MAYDPRAGFSTGTTRTIGSGGGGHTAFGGVPQAIANPDPYANLSALYPNLSGANEQISRNVMSELRGELSPETIAAIQDNAATFGVTSGMPGSQFAGRKGLRSLGIETERLQGQGLQDYLASITGISKTQTLDPALEAEIATQNAVWNAAPDPELAARREESLFEKYARQFRGPAGGTEDSPWARPPITTTTYTPYKAGY